MLVNFIGVGAQKCASSWVYDVLADHPQAAVPDIKELDFFSYHYERGMRWYEAQFGAAALRARAVGEISPSYLHEAGVVERAKAYNPRLRILVSLRDPVERALSQHRHLARLGLLPAEELQFEPALQTNPTYVEQGCYHRHLKRWIDAFGSERVHVILMEDIESSPIDVVRALYAFLDIDKGHTPAALHQKSNPSYLVRSRVADRTVRLVRNTLTQAGLRRAWQRLGDTGLRHAYRKLNRQPSHAVLPPPRPETLVALRQRFAPEVERLSVLINRDLSAWLPATSRS